MISAVIFEANENALEHLKMILNDMRYINVCESFVNKNTFLKSIGKYKPDVAIIDMESSSVVRTDFLSDIEKISNETDIFFVTVEMIYFYYTFLKNSRTDFSLMFSKKRETIGFHIEDSREQTPYIRCFGKLEVYKNKNNTQENIIRWRTKKTKELFAYLLCQYGKNVSKEELIRALFPEKEDGLNNLYVTMSFLKKQISDLNLKKSDIVIKNNYFLEVADGICDFIDAERYINKHIVIDDQNISQFLLILDSFRGTFLEEEDYLWAYDTREYLEKKYEEVLLKIGKYYGRKKNFEEARNAIERIIHRNPLSCEAHAEFLNLYLYFKRYDLFLTQYRRYARLLKEEYGEVPEIEYAEAYQKLWSNWNKD